MQQKTERFFLSFFSFCLKWQKQEFLSIQFYINWTASAQQTQNATRFGKSQSIKPSCSLPRINLTSSMFSTFFYNFEAFGGLIMTTNLTMDNFFKRILMKKVVPTFLKS